MCKLSDPKAFKDTFWNAERVRRNLKDKDIAVRLSVTQSTVASWFCGRRMPSDSCIADLCTWFSDLDPEYPISFSLGKMQFQAMHEEYIAETSGKTIIMSGESTEEIKNMAGRKAKTRIGQLVRESGFKYEDIANRVHVSVATVKSWMQGVTKPEYGYIEEIADMLEMPIPTIDKLFDDAYLSKHSNPNQETVFDIPENQADPEDSTDEDFQPDRKEEKTSTDEEEYSFSPEVEKALSDRSRFVRWFKYYSNVLFVRPDVVAHLMYVYTQTDYNMWDAIEAWYHEYGADFLILRTIISAAEQVKYFGEEYESFCDNMEV